MIELSTKQRCSLSKMPSDITWNHTAQIPYLNQSFHLVKSEAEEAGFEIEHWSEDSSAFVTLQARGPEILILVTRRGLVKAMGNNAWNPLPPDIPFNPLKHEQTK